jgi:hypothetical protein
MTSICSAVFEGFVLIFTPKAEEYQEILFSWGHVVV